MSDSSKPTGGSNPLVGFSASGPGISVASGIIGMGINRKQNIDNMDFASAEAQKQRDWQERMWHMQNEYNAPSAVMQRLKDAGLNPNLAYGQIGGMSGNVGQGSQANSPTQYPLQTPDPLNAVNKVAQIHALEGQANQSNSQASINWTDAEFRSILNSQNVQLNYGQILLNESIKNLTDEQVKQVKAIIEQIGIQNDELHSKIEVLQQQAGVLSQQQKELFLKNMFSSVTFITRVKQITADLNKTYADIHLEESQVRRWMEQTAIETFNANTNRINARTSQFDANTRRLDYNAHKPVYEKQALMLGSMSFALDASGQSTLWNLENDKDFRSIERSLSIAKSVQSFTLDYMNSMSQMIGALK